MFRDIVVVIFKETVFQQQKRYPCTRKELCDKDLAELSEELSGVIYLKPLLYW